MKIWHWILIGVMIGGVNLPPLGPTGAAYGQDVTVGTDVPTPPDRAANRPSRSIFDLLSEKTIATKCRGNGIRQMAIHVTWNNPPQSTDAQPAILHGVVPAGTVFQWIPREGVKNAQNMMATRDHMFTITPDMKDPVKVPVACMNRELRIPGSKDRFIMKPPHLPALAALANVLEEADVNADTAQAAMWIVSDDADYKDLGILCTVYFDKNVREPIYRRQIDAYETVVAMKLCDDAGVDIRRKRIWQDRWVRAYGLGVEKLGLGEWALASLRTPRYGGDTLAHVVRGVIADADVAQHAGKAIDLAGELNLTDTWPKLLKLSLANGDRDMKQQAWDTAAKLGGEESIPTFTKLTAESNRNMLREQAYKALGVIYAHAATPAKRLDIIKTLGTAVSDDYQYLQRAGIAILGSLYATADSEKERAAITQTLIPLADDEDSIVRGEAMAMLAKSESLVAARALHAQLKDEQAARHAVAALCLMRIDGVAPLLKDAATVKEGQYVNKVLAALQELPFEQAQPVLAALAASKLERVRRGVADTLNKIGPEKTAPLLVAMLNDSSAAVRWQAQQALTKSDVDCVATVEKSIGTFSEQGKLAAINVLAAKADPKSGEPLLALLDDKSTAVQVAAAKALGSIKATAALPALRKRVDKLPYGELRDTLRTTIEKLQAASSKTEAASN